MKDAYSFRRDCAGAAPGLPSQMFVAYTSRTFAAHGLEVGADGGPKPGRLAAISATSSSSWRKPVEPGLLPRRPFEMRMPPADSRFGGDLAPLDRAMDQAPTRLPTRSMTPRRFRGGGSPAKRASARIEVGARSFFFRRPVFRTDGVLAYRDRRQRRLRLRWAPMASACPAWSGPSIEASHDGAGIIWPVPVAPIPRSPWSTFSWSTKRPTAASRRSLRQACARAEHLGALRGHATSAPGQNSQPWTSSACHFS